MKKFTTLKTLLVGLLVCAATSAWAGVVDSVAVNCDFNNGETLFTGVSRFSVENDNNVKFVCSHNSTNGYSLATYDFSSAIGTNATAVKIEFAFWIPNENAAYRRFFTIGQADYRTGFGKQAYSTAGSMFAFGLARISSANYFSINGASTTAAASAGTVLGNWAHAEIYVDHSKKTVNYKITSMDGQTTYYSANDVAFVDGTASYCNQIDFFDCQNNAVSYLDNLVITKYVDNSKVATTYTVKYQNAGGTVLKDAVSYNTFVGDSFTATNADMATFYSDDTNIKYVYASGNESKKAQSSANDNVITLVFDEYEKVSYSIIAVDEDNTELQTLNSGEAYADGSTTIYLSKYIKIEDQWYVTDEKDFKVTIVEAGSNTVIYKKSNIAYFFEMESLTRNGGSYVTEDNDGYSGGKRLRLSKGSQHYTPALNAGNYLLNIPWENSNENAAEVYVYTRDSEGNLSDILATFTAPKGSGTFAAIINVPEGHSIAFNGNEGSYNNNARMDYMILTEVPETVPATIGSNGFSTFASEYNVKLPSGVTAYTAQVNTDGKSVKFNKIDSGEIPANKGVLLEGTAGATITLDVIASATALGTNEFKVNTTGEKFAAEEGVTYFAMEKGTTPLTFKKVNPAEVAIPANKAYLTYAPAIFEVSARLTAIFDGEATAIKTVENAKAGNTIYNLNGQRVDKAQKGLYIVNGKKTIVK